MGDESKMLEKKEDEIAKRISSIEKRIKIDDSNKDAALVSGKSDHKFIPFGNRSDSFEAKTLSFFGRKHISELMNINVAHPRYRHVPYEYKSAVITIKENIDINRWVAQMKYGGACDSDSKTGNCIEALETKIAKEELIPQLKAFDTTDFASWIPTAHTSSFLDEFELEKKIPALFRELRMSTNPWKLSVKTSNTVAKIAAENASLIADAFAVGNITFDAIKFAEYFPITTELDEDSIVDVLRIAREELTESQIRAVTEYILNGDDTATHMDDDTAGGAASLAQKALKGLRKLAIDNIANGSVVDVASAMTVAKLDEMRTSMGKFGVQVRDLVYIVSPTVYHQMVNLAEVSSVDQVGNNATLLSGALAFFRGIPVVIAEQCREDTATTGVNTGAGPNDKAVAYLVNKRRFFIGMRRPVQIRVMRDLPSEDRWLLSSTHRSDFKGHPQDAGEQSVILARDITV